MSDAKIIEIRQEIIRFQYKYVYYYFVAKYLANNMYDDDIKQKISILSKKLYREECANIVMFLTHHSKDPFILNQLLSNAQLIFNEFEPIKFENDIIIINNLLEEIPKLVLEDKDIKQYREKKLKKQDEIELAEQDVHDEKVEESLSSDEDVGSLSMVNKLNLAFKTLEIIGQILKNYYGSLKLSKKLDLGEEAYLIGLRSLNYFFVWLNNNVDSIVNYITSIIKPIIDKKKNLVLEERIEKFSKRLLFHFCELISASFIIKIAEFMGSENLYETHAQILEKNNFTSVNMIDIAIKLGFYKGFPFNDIKKLKQKISNNVLPYRLLQRMVINYLYMFPTSYKDKNRICDILEIPMAVQISIDELSTQKKIK